MSTVCLCQKWQGVEGGVKKSVGMQQDGSVSD